MTLVIFIALSAKYRNIFIKPFEGKSQRDVPYCEGNTCIEIPRYYFGFGHIFGPIKIKCGRSMYPYKIWIHLADEENRSGRFQITEVSDSSEIGTFTLIE